MVSKDCAIFFEEDAYSINSKKLMGRNSAGASFLKGYFSNGNPKNFWVYAKERNQAQNFADILSDNSSRKDAKYISWTNFTELKEPGNLFFPGPNFNKIAWQRRFFAENAWSICGITHTTSSATAMDAIGDYYLAPTKSWDALICTSNAVKDNVQFILENKKKYLRDEVGLSKFEGPKLPVIPLGINTKEFEFSQNDRFKARNKLTIEKNCVVIAYVGRLSFHAKANPIAMYSAIEKAASLNPSKNIKILECGWFQNDWIQNAFVEIEKTVLSKVELIRVDGRDQGNVKMVWQAADIFCSFSDNIQETFGISPIEAMASSLPVVVSNWNGYKESVRDGIDGFKISTLMPEGGLGRDLAISHAMDINNYDHYVGKTSAFISVDIDQATDRFDKLIKSEDLRYELGANAKKQAVEKYDWKRIIPQYENLWLELGEERKKSVTQSQPKAIWPERSDPFFSFAHYASSKLNMSDKLKISRHSLDETIDRFTKLKSIKMSSFITSILPNDDEFLQVFESVENNALTVQNLLTKFDKSRQPFVYRSLFWLLKVGLLKLVK